MKWLAILNPTAHNGDGLARLRSLARLLHQELGAECAWSNYPRHAGDLARNSRDFDGLIAVGGDGTISEVVNGMNRKTQSLGIVPAGTGNGLAHELRLRNDFAAIRQLRQEQLARLDLIKVRFRAGADWQERYVVHTSALGYIAELVALAMGPLKPLGALRYAAAACVRGCSRKRFLARLRIDDGPEQPLVLSNLAVNNTRYAGPFCVCPKADLQDGRLNLLYANNLPRHQLVEDVGILTQTYVGGRSVRCAAQAVSVDLAQPLTLMLDGELVPQVEAVRFQVIPGGLRCVVGSRSGLTLDEPRVLARAAARPATDEMLAQC